MTKEKKEDNNKDKDKDKDKDFMFPTELVEQIYEISGGADYYKGVFLCVCSPKGTPQIYTRFDSIVTSLGMKKAIQSYLDNDDLAFNQPQDTDEE